MNISYDLEESCSGLSDNLSSACFIPEEEKSDCILQYRNLSELKPAQDAYVIPFGVKLIWILAYTTMIIISVSGNSIIIWIILGHRKMRTVTNIFILNLSIADLIISLFNTTFNFIFMLSGHWYFGYFFCKINNFLVYLTLTASIFTIMAVSIERYRIVVVPMKPRISKNGCIKWLLLIWLISGLISLPTLIYAQHETFGDNKGDPPARHICFLEWPDGGPGCSKWDLMYNLVIFLMDYAIPMAIMGVTYFKIGKIFWANQGIGELTTSQYEAIKSRKRVVSMLLSLTIVFAICWLPYHAFFLYIFFDPLFLYSKFISNIYLGTFFLAMSNSAINPIIYALLSRSYGRPAEGSKTLQRGLKAHSHVSNEIRYLCEVIKDSGIPQDDGTFVITFGKLFQIYTVISDKVVGTLLRARKYGFVEFEGEMLYQRRDDYTLIHLKQMPPKDFQLKF